MTTETKLVLSFGSNKHHSNTLYFHAIHNNDAVTQFAKKVIEFDEDPEVYAGWVNLSHKSVTDTPVGTTISAWTKTSNERPTEPGSPDA